MRYDLETPPPDYSKLAQQKTNGQTKAPKKKGKK